MKMRNNLYKLLVNRIPGIRDRYNESYNKFQGKNRIFRVLFLLQLNLQYYVFRKKDLKESKILNPDYGKKIKYCEAEAFSIDFSEIINSDIVCFDVFDTLILRKVEKPTDVFYMVQEKLNYPNFKKLRERSEYEARQERYKNFGDYEVTIREIWQRLHEITGLDLENGINIEIQAELEFCYGNPFFLDLIEKIKPYKKKMIICSDMYLGSDVIQLILKKAGFINFEDYFISSDLRKSKHNGNLYSYVREKIGNNFSYIQIGDNEFSDILQAKKNNFKAIHYPNVQIMGNKYRAKDMSSIVSSIYSGIINPYLYNGRNKYSMEFEFGYIYGGLFVVGFCQYIHKYIENHNVEKALFLSRDGDIVKQIYEILYPENKDLCEYTYWSRLSSIKVCAPIFKQFFFERLLLNKTNQGYKLLDIFKTMDLESLLLIFLKENKYSNDTAFEQNVCEEVIQFLDDRWDQVCEIYQEEAEECKKYYERVINGAKNVVFIDVGWVGTGPLMLIKLFKDVWKFEGTAKGIVAGTCSGNGIDFDSSALELANGTLNSYLFSPNNNRDIWKKHDAQKGHNMIVELLLSSPEHSFRSFKKDENGKYVYNKTIESINSLEIQNGIIMFAKQFKNHPFNKIEISGRDSIAPILLIYENEDYLNYMLRLSKIKPNVE